MLETLLASGGKGRKDPYGDLVTLLLHMDGTPGSNIIIDSSDNNEFEAGSGVYLSDAQSVFGGTSAFFNANGSWIEAPNIPGYSFGTGDFTMEGFSYFTSLAGTGNLSQWNTLFTLSGSNADGGGSVYYCVVVKTDGSFGLLNRPENGPGWFNVLTQPNSILLNQWYHWAIVRINGVIAIYLNGVPQQLSIAGEGTANAVNGVGPLRIGRLLTSSNYDWQMRGYQDDIRFTKGHGRYNGAFTPPGKAFSL
jgi:hypothetical protein